MHPKLFGSDASEYCSEIEASIDNKYYLEYNNSSLKPDPKSSRTFITVTIYICNICKYNVDEMLKDI